MDSSTTSSASKAGTPPTCLVHSMPASQTSSGVPLWVRRKAGGGLHDHQGDNVAGVVAVFVDTADGDELARGVSGARLGGALRPDLVAFRNLKHEAVGELLGLLPGDPPGGDVRLGKAAYVLVETAVADAVQLSVENQAQLIEIAGLQGFLVGAGAVLHDPVERVGHLLELCLAGGIGALGSLAGSFGGVTLGVDDQALGYEVDRSVELVAAAIVALKALVQKLTALGACLVANGAQTGVDDLPKIAAEVADGVLGVAVVDKVEDAGAQQLLVLLGQVLVDDGAHAVLVPEVPRLLDVVVGLLVDVVRVNPARGQGVDLIQEPPEGVLGEEGASTEALGGKAHDELVLADGGGHLLKEIAQVLGALHDAGDVWVLHVELGDQLVAVEVDLGLGSAVALADTLDTGGDRCDLVHGLSFLD